jgi:large subunit ribosomal protein L35
MPGSAKPGKIRSHSSAKKRFKRTGKGLLANQKPAHNHLLGQKSKRQKRIARQTFITNPVYGKMLKRMLSN